MKIIIKNKINLIPSDIKELKPIFGINGRRFNLQVEGKKWIKNISLNDLISSVLNAAKKPGHDVNELKEFSKTFKVLKNKGYTGFGCAIKKENFLVELITRIKHFFAAKKRNKLLNELDQVIQRTSHLPQKLFQNIDPIKEAIIDELEEKPEEPFNFELLPQDMQLEILRDLDIKSFLAFYQADKKIKLLIENRLGKKLKKAQLEQRAFLKWEVDFKDLIYRGTTKAYRAILIEEFENLIEEFDPSHSNDMIKDLDELLLFSKDKNLPEYQFNYLIKVAKAVSVSQPKMICEVLKKAIDTRLVNKQKIQLEEAKSLEVLKCIELMARIDPANAAEYKVLLRSNLKAAQNKEMSFAYLKVLGLIDPVNLKEYKNLLRFDITDSSQSRKRKLLSSLVNNYTAFNFEQVFEMISHIQNESLKLYGLEIMMYRNQHVNFIPFIQKIIELSQNSDRKDVFLDAAAHAYMHFGKLEKAMLTIEKMGDSYRGKNMPLINLAKAYAKINPQESLHILEKVQANDANYNELIDVYALTDIEKAQELCNQIQVNSTSKMRALLAITNVLKNKNIEATNQMWENIYQLARKTGDLREPTLTLLKIVRQMAEVNPKEAKQFLENKLHPFTRKDLFEGIVREKMLGRMGDRICNMKYFKTLIEAYALIDPIETENWMKEFDGLIGCSFQSRALLILKDSIR